MRICDRVMALAEASEARFENRSATREKRLLAADRGNIWAADDPNRVAKRFAHVRALESAPMVMPGAPLQRITMTPSGIDAGIDSIVASLAQERTIGRDDLVAPQFLKRALAASRCVCRITVRGDDGGLIGYGTGTLVGPGILLTNNHVLERSQDAAQSEATFGFEAGGTSEDEERIVRFDPQRLFVTDKELDFTFVALAPLDHRGQVLDDLTYISLNQNEGKVINGEYVNVIQHPNGGPKMFALRENRVVDVLTNFLHYEADTAPGSSGAPVFNDQFEVVALHHSGVPQRDGQGRVLNRNGQLWTSDQGEAQVEWRANEGVRVSVLVERARSLTKTNEEQALLAKSFDLARSVPRLESAVRAVSAAAARENDPVIIGSSVTWTIPLSVSVSLPMLNTAPRSPAPPAAEPTSPPASPTASTSISTSVVRPALTPAGTSAELMRAVGRAKDAFRSIPGILRVRSGWKFSDGWITDQPAIVVIVEQKKTSAELDARDEARLPTTFEGFAVDVRQSSAEELYELRLVGTGIALEERTANPAYVKPAHLSLPRVKEPMKLTVHVSPEHGWPVLKRFLEATTQRLTVGMYDFGAPHIIDAVKAAIGSQDANMKLVIQYGASTGEGTKAQDLDDTDTVKQLSDALGDKFVSQWANVGQSGSLWASAYHIKVAVRDSNAFWLSSGNWQSSNQAPDAPPTKEAASRDLLTRYNREWHVVMENKTLSRVLESYINYDFDQSQGFVPRGAPAAFELLDVLEPDRRELAREIRTFEPLEIDRVVDVQPVLTPDNYVPVVLELIQGATSRIYFQNQYINESLDDRAAQSYIPLVDALAKQQQAGLDVRIILRGDNGVDARHIEFLKTHGIDMSKVRWRMRTHTKGIIVDSSRVLLGSHNWSFDGTVLNRDASLLFYDAEIAKYLEDIFVYDWENWSTSRVSVRQKKPRVDEASSPEEIASIRARAIQGDEVRIRRLFECDD